MNNLWLETDYFNDFKCKCGDCKRMCCSSFVIPVSKNEYYKLLTLPTSLELSNKIESCFIAPDFPTEDRYRLIARNYLGNCPMLDENGLCMIQNELGEDALAEVCRSYPRSLKNINGKLMACCSNSCEAVIELLIKKDDFSFHEVINNNKPNITLSIKDDIDLSLKFINIIQDRSIDLNKRILKICNILNDNIGNDNELNGFVQTINFIETVSHKSQIYDDFKQMVTAAYKKDEDGFKQYKNDELAFISNYPNWMIYFENIIVNHLYYSTVPFNDNRLSRTDYTKGLCLLYALLKVICSAALLVDHSQDNFIYIVSDIFHLIEHTPFYYNANIVIKNELTLLQL